MSLPSASAPTNALRQSTADPRLQGHWLLLARMACAVGVLLALGPFTADLLVRFSHLSRLSAFDVPSGSAWTPVTLSTALAQVGLSVGFYQLYRIALDLLVTLSFVLVATLLLWRKSDEGMALLVALFLVNFGAAWATNLDELAALYPAWSWLFALANQLSWALLLAFFFLFPNGRFVPRWTRWWWVVLTAGDVLSLFISPLRAVPVLQLALVNMLVSGVLAQIYRYRRRASPVERQQIKWAVVGFAATVAGLVAYFSLGAVVPALGPPGTAGLLYVLAGDALGGVLFLPIPLCVGIALLRYRLWGIDWIINQALVYGALTALLAAVYSGLIIGLESLVGGVTKQASQPLAIVLSTLAIAAVFLPARRRIQASVDRRFYRRKYDATRTLAAFGATVRNEVELERVRERLLAVVNETMQPAQVSLWLRPPERHEGQSVQPDAAALAPYSAGRRPLDDNALAP